MRVLRSVDTSQLPGGLQQEMRQNLPLQTTRKHQLLCGTNKSNQKYTAYLVLDIANSLSYGCPAASLLIEWHCGCRQEYWLIENELASERDRREPLFWSSNSLWGLNTRRIPLWLCVFVCWACFAKESFAINLPGMADTWTSPLSLHQTVTTRVTMQIVSRLILRLSRPEVVVVVGWVVLETFRLVCCFPSNSDWWWWWWWAAVADHHSIVIVVVVVVVAVVSYHEEAFAGSWLDERVWCARISLATAALVVSRARLSNWLYLSVNTFITAATTAVATPPPTNINPLSW